MIRAAIMSIVAAILIACSTPPMTPNATPAVVADLAPTGKLRAVINLAEFIEDMKAAGFEAGALARHGIEGAAVAPATAGS